MIRRICAWLLLAGFIFLILNLFLFRWFLEISAIIYIIISAVYVIFSFGKKRTSDAVESIERQDNKTGGEEKHEN